MKMLRRLAFPSLMASALLSSACRKSGDPTVLSERDATVAKDHAGNVLATAATGLEKTAATLATTPLEALVKDAIQAKRILVDARRGIDSLRTAPLSFVAIVDATSKVVRSSLEVDALATERIDPACGAASSAGSLTTVLPGRLGPALLLCSPLPRRGEGALVAGFGYADLAIVLRNHVRDGYDSERDAGRFSSKTPLLYAAVFDDKRLAWTPETPDITRAAAERTGFRDGSFRGPITFEVEERAYAISKRELVVAKGIPLSFVIVHSDI